MVFTKIINSYERKNIIKYVKKRDTFDEEFYELIPKESNKDKLNLEIWKIFSAWFDYEGSGIIFAGYNLNSYWPTFFEINIKCNDNGNLIYREIDSKINCRETFIKIFAIKEEAYAFLTGINEDIEENIKWFIYESNEKFICKLEQELMKNNFSIDAVKQIIQICNSLITTEKKNIDISITDYKDNTIQYTSESLEYLPNNLICELADYLIQLTGLKQKIFENIETVSIETNVGLLTKSDYFKWVK